MERGPFAASRRLRDTRVSEDHVQAGAAGALLAVMVETSAVADDLGSMEQLAFSGPFSELLEWGSFEERLGAFTKLFDGLDGHLAPGFHLLVDGGGNRTRRLSP